MDLVINKKIPKSTDGYYLSSLIRISDDDNYINKINALIEAREQKGKKEKYYNSGYKPSKGAYNAPFLWKIYNVRGNIIFKISF